MDALISPPSPQEDTRLKQRPQAVPFSQHEAWLHRIQFLLDDRGGFDFRTDTNRPSDLR